MESLSNSLPDYRSIARARLAPEVVKFAYDKFPDISEDLISQNLCELITAQDAEWKCSACCVGLGMCPELLNTAGYTYVLAMQANGKIKMEYAPCEFNGGRKNEKMVVTRSDNYKQLEFLGG